jgi:uncharacterized protein YceH (UPF0502 family)
VLGCLIEKRFTTPDQYPLSLNALRLACNQSTNRNPITSYEESVVRAAAQRLCELGLARLASTHTSRAIKYRHLAEEARGRARQELALVAVLLLRGAQTPGELKVRCERMASFGSLGELEAVLQRLCERGLARRLSRRPGQKEDRYEHALGAADGGAQRYVEAGMSTPAGAPSGALPTAPSAPSGERARAEEELAERLAALEARVASLERALGEL